MTDPKQETKCERCEEWSRQGLSETCPACDMVEQETLDEAIERLAEEFVSKTAPVVFEAADKAGITYNDELTCVLMNDSYENGQRDALKSPTLIRHIDPKLLAEHHPGVIRMTSMLEKMKNQLEEGGAYLVEEGFEEPLHCALFRECLEALAPFRKEGV